MTKRPRPDCTEFLRGGRIEGHDGDWEGLLYIDLFCQQISPERRDRVLPCSCQLL